MAHRRLMVSLISFVLWALCACQGTLSDDLWADGGDADQQDEPDVSVGPCSGVSCSGHGECNFHDRIVECLCEEGYRDQGLACLPVEADGDADLDVELDGAADADGDSDGPADAEADLEPDADEERPPSCGDGSCDDDEDAEGCPADCPAFCGDGACTHSEAAAGCPMDCPAICGDGACTHAETAGTCAADCAGFCGDHLCTTGETAAACPGDCPASCGDGACTHAETHSSCPADCPGAVTLTFPATGDTRVSAGTTFEGAGNYVEGVRTPGLAAINRVDFVLQIGPNTLTCDSQDVRLVINGVQVINFPIQQSYATMEGYATFAPIAGPTYTLRYETTRAVTAGCGGAGYPNDVSTITLTSP